VRFLAVYGLKMKRARIYAVQCPDKNYPLNKSAFSTINVELPKTDGLGQDYLLTGDRQANLRRRGLNRGFRTV
jgi:hypothetical protein